MSPPRLYCPVLRTGRVALSKEESHHAVASLRIAVGDDVVLFDGEGVEGRGCVADITSPTLEVDVTHIVHHAFELSYRVTLAVAMPRAHRQGYLIEKCTELGVAAIWPILAERSVARPAAKSIERLRRRAIEAAKQSQRSWVPQVNAPQSLEASVQQVGAFRAVGMADGDPSVTPINTFFSRVPPSSEIIVWVGPEGGWSDHERAMMIEAGATPVRLGPTVLRTETAAVAICTAAALLAAR